MVMAFVIAAQAEEQLPLQPIDRSPIPGEKKCSDLFYTNDFGGSMAVQVVIAYKTADGKIKRDTIPGSRIIPYLSDKPPTYEKPDVLRLSQADHAKLQACLPNLKLELKPEPPATP